MKNTFLVVSIVSSQWLFSQNITIGTLGDFPTLAAAESSMDPGDTVFLLDQIFVNGTQFLTVNGTEDNPIVIKAQNAHAAIFRGGTEAIHLVNCSYVEVEGIVVEQQTGNGINIDDGGDYNTPTHHITIRNCIFQDMAAAGNNDLLKLSGLDDFKVCGNQFLNGGAGGSGVDMVGCHHGVIEDNLFDAAGVTGVQAKGGTQFILMQRNVFKDMSQRAINLGGSTGLQYFRPPLPNPIVNAFEAADLEVYSNVFIGSWAPIAYVGCVRVKVINNTIYKPENWVIRILQETTDPGFLACADNEFRNNIVYLENDLTEVNVGSQTNPGSFQFSNNLWFNEGSNSWSPQLPVTDINQIIADPLFIDASQEDFDIAPNSPAVEGGLSLPNPSTDFVLNYYYSPPSAGAFEGHSSTTSAPYIIADNCISMGPNPSAGEVRIDGDLSDAQIKVIDAGGIVVQDHSHATAPISIKLSELNNGLYFIQIIDQSNQSVHVQRIIKNQ